MKLKSLVCDCFQVVKKRIFVENIERKPAYCCPFGTPEAIMHRGKGLNYTNKVSWISLVVFIFYNTFIYYKYGRQFYYLRNILGLGLCVSRATATVLNVCCALVLLPLCKKLNQILYRVLSKVWPGLFFFWLEKAKSFHMTVAMTLVFFAVIHSISHFVNLWNFSRGFDEERLEINFANYRNQSPIVLLMSTAGLTGISMLLITISMTLTSTRWVRRRIYNAFWFTHQLYLPFIVLVIIHPMSGVLKEEILDTHDTSPISSHNMNNNWTNTTIRTPRFNSIKSKTWMWMAVPLSCFVLDLLWRVCSRNMAKVDILEVTHMAGRTLSLTLSRPHAMFSCRKGQYVLLQCLDISLIEWHPFTVVKVPTDCQSNFVVWIRVKGDWTEALEKLLLEREPSIIRVLVDGPFSSPMEGASRSEVALCVAAGVGITPFVALLYDMFLNPRSRYPGRIHLIWIVRNEKELTWLAALANRAIWELRNANRPDRLHLEFYVTCNKENSLVTNEKALSYMAVINEKGGIQHVVNKIDRTDDEKITLLTPNKRRNGFDDANGKLMDDYNIAKEFPLVGCRVRRGRPHWDRVFGYWVHLYPGRRLNLYACGPKKLMKCLRSKSNQVSRTTKTKFTFVHEVFS